MFDFPTSPAPGQSYISGGVTYMWNGYAWIGGGIAQTPTNQFFDLSGLPQLDIPVPTWAKHVEFTGFVPQTGAASQVGLRVSDDGSTFKAGASDYALAGPTHNVGSAGYATQASTNVAYMALTPTSDVANTVPFLFNFDLALVRPSTSVLFGGKAYGKVTNTGATLLNQTQWWVNLVNSGTTALLAIKALRLFLGPSGNFPAGSYVQVKWLGDTGQLAVGNYAAANLPRGYLAGLGLSNNATTPASKIDVAPGQCRDDSNTANLVLPFGTIDFATVGPNGLDTGAMAGPNWYHVFAIGKPDTSVARLGSLSLTPALPAGYTFKRRIGSVRVSSTPALNSFFQKGDEFYWAGGAGSFQDLNYSSGGTGGAWTSQQLTVPTGIVVTPLLTGYMAQNATAGVLTYQLDSPQIAAAANPVMVAYTQNASQVVYFNVDSGGLYTNTLGQILWRMTTSAPSSSPLSLLTRGWVDRRDRDA